MYYAHKTRPFIAFVTTAMDLDVMFGDVKPWQQVFSLYLCNHTFGPLLFKPNSKYEIEHKRIELNDLSQWEPVTDQVWIDLFDSWGTCEQFPNIARQDLSREVIIENLGDLGFQLGPDVDPKWKLA